MKYYILLLMTMFFSTTSVLASEWELEKYDEENDIKVYTRLKPNSNSDFKEFKATTHIKSRITPFIALLNNADLACEWMYNCIEFKFIDEASATKKTSYSINNAPWPVTDRDFVIDSETQQDKDSYAVTITLSSASDKVANDDNYVRVKDLQGKWQFIPLDNGIVEVTYQLFLDPAGSVPSMIATTTFVDTPYYTLLNLRKIITKPELQSQQLDHISEPPANE
ncbi:START domain-containing protein [Moritella viscosa]|uniref:START domain-containing protein n=1 Tax=Moritella viscosa TaxID=80854 RepID=UPI000921C5B0|nr:START domain-containing protein [Moritella viscosa]SHO11946.1 Ser-Asp rich fibrinogen/bone sialoprotein-binding protein SdrD [Moritella viscosa]SHO11947.1 Ser-Asp rich fibrinogen/bone sialoprotein-binding protein SdrD [Moritella viscosa]SHO18221.1 Ser-Asp rich fibrinogen/bone sialoprotein-binding protein SdrD [Moritella viscosa]